MDVLTELADGMKTQSLGYSHRRNSGREEMAERYAKIVEG